MSTKTKQRRENEEELFDDIEDVEEMDISSMFGSSRRSTRLAEEVEED